MKRRSSQIGALPQPYGKYELLERIGTGGMAEVYRARLPGIGGFEKVVVIKRLRPRHAHDDIIVRLFVEEAKLAAQVHHKNVVQVYELGETDSGELYIAMEYVRGTDLRRLLDHAARSEASVSPGLAVYVVTEVLEALAYAHALHDDRGRARELVHCDVTPENIFVSRTGDVKLGDFGVATDATREHDPLADRAKGKLPYMSPEQVLEQAIDARTDVYSVGVVLWEVLAGRRLFPGRTPSEVMAQICASPRPPPSRFSSLVTPDLDRVVLRAIDPDIRRRYQSAHDLAAALHRAAGELHGLPSPSAAGREIEAILDAPVTRPEVDPYAPIEADDGHEELEALDRVHERPIPVAPSVVQTSSPPPGPPPPLPPASSPGAGPFSAPTSPTSARADAPPPARPGSSPARPAASPVGPAASPVRPASSSGPVSGRPPITGTPLIPPGVHPAASVVGPRPSGAAPVGSQPPQPSSVGATIQGRPVAPPPAGGPASSRSSAPAAGPPAPPSAVPTGPRPRGRYNLSTPRPFRVGEEPPDPRTLTPTKPRMVEPSPEDSGSTYRIIRPRPGLTPEPFMEDDAETILHAYLTDTDNVVDRDRHAAPWSSRHVTLAPVLGGAAPLWIRYGDGRLRGPLSPTEALEAFELHLRSGSLHRIEVSADRQSWLRPEELARLLGEALMPTRPRGSPRSELGSLAERSLVELIGRLGRAGRTGRLVVWSAHDAERIELHVLTGNLTHINWTSAPFEVWRHHLDDAFLGSEGLPEAFGLALATRTPVPERLSRSTLEHLGKNRVVHARRRFERALSWTEGGFHFDPISNVSVSEKGKPLLRYLPGMTYCALSMNELERRLRPRIDRPHDVDPALPHFRDQLGLTDGEIRLLCGLGGPEPLGERIRRAATEIDEKFVRAMAYILGELGLIVAR